MKFGWGEVLREVFQFVPTPSLSPGGLRRIPPASRHQAVVRAPHRVVGAGGGRGDSGLRGLQEAGAWLGSKTGPARENEDFGGSGTLDLFGKRMVFIFPRNLRTSVAFCAGGCRPPFPPKRNMKNNQQEKRFDWPVKSFPKGCARRLGPMFQP